MNIPAQVIGVIALIAAFISFQQTKRKKFLFFQIIASLSYALHYLLLNALSGVATGLISISKNLIFYKYEKQNKKINVFIFITLQILVIICGIITYNGLISLLPILTTLISTYGSWQKDLKKTYTFVMFNSILWVIYNFFVGGYVLIINSVIELIGGIIGFVKVSNKRKKEKSKK